MTIKEAVKLALNEWKALQAEALQQDETGPAAFLDAARDNIGWLVDEAVEEWAAANGMAK